MKHKLLALALVFTAYSNLSSAQNTCGYDEWVKMHNQSHPGYKEAIDNDLLDALNMNNDRSVDFSDKIYTIRVVFHVLYNTQAQNVNDTELKKQINALNRDYGAYNPDRVNIRPMFDPYVGGDSRIRFELATTKPDGSETNGIERKQTTITSFYSTTTGEGMADAVKRDITGGLDAWDPAKYLNIWVCNFNNSAAGGIVVGYATPPPGLLPYWSNEGGDPNLQGIVLSPSVVGDNIPATKGRTCVHEVGHYLGLRHIWGDAQPACGEDFIWDTPPGADQLLGWTACSGRSTTLRKFRVLPIGSNAFQYPATYSYDTLKTFKLQFNNTTFKNDTVWQGQVRIDKFDNAENATTVPDADSTSYFLAYPSGFWTYKKDTSHVSTFVLDTITGITDTIISIQVNTIDSIYFTPVAVLTNATYTKILVPNTCKLPSFNPNLPANESNLGDLPDFLEDYMSYTDEKCTVAFTNEQVRLMQNVLVTRRLGIATMTINGLNSLDASRKLKFAPNPANEFVTIENAPANSLFQISNISGQTVFAGVLDSKTVDVSSLSNGIYTIKVTTKNETLVNKIVISK